MNVHSFLVATMSTPPPTTDKREAILKATLELLASRGFHGFSIKQLAQQAGVAAGTIYLYFKDRETLIGELQVQIFSDIANAILAEDDELLPLKERHARLSRSIWQFCIAHPDVILSKAQFDHLPPDLLRSQHEAAWDLFKPLANLFENGRQRGLIKNLPDDVLSVLCFEPQTNLARQHILGLISINEADLAQVIEATWHAIAASPDSDL